MAVQTSSEARFFLRSSVYSSGFMSKGFTLIELIMVIVILGILSVAAAPRFIDISDAAVVSTNQAMASSMQQGAQLVKMKWILAGQPQTNSAGDAPIVQLNDSLNVAVDPNSGFPVGGDIADSIDDVNGADCIAIFTLIVETDLTTATRGSLTNANFKDVDLYIKNTSNTTNTCIYYWTRSVSSRHNDETPTFGIGFQYFPGTGKVITFDFGSS